MPRQAPRGGPRPLTRQWSVRLLACRFEIAVDCERLAAWLDVMLSRATQRYPVSRVHRFAVRREGGGYCLLEDGVAFGREGSAESAGYALTARKHGLVALDAAGEPVMTIAGHQFGKPEIELALASLGLPESSPLSVLAVEMLPELNRAPDPLGTDLGSTRILRSSRLVPVPPVCVQPPCP